MSSCQALPLKFHLVTKLFSPCSFLVEGLMQRLFLRTSKVCSLVGAFTVRHASSLTPRSQTYVDALKHVIASSPKSGVQSDAIAQKLSELLLEDSDPTRFGFSKLTQALCEVNDIHYVAKKSTLVPCNWENVLQRIQPRLPLEGVLKSQFIRLVAQECPDFNSDSIPGSCIEDWVSNRFPHLFKITWSSNNGHCIFRPLPKNNLRNTSIEQIDRALALLDRDPLMPVKTDLEQIRPLLPNGKGERSWVEVAFTNPIVSSKFDVEVDVEFVVDASSVMPHIVFVDGTSVSQCDIPRAARVAGLDPHVVRSLSANLCGKSDTSAFLKVHVVRHANSAPISSSDFVLDSFVEARDELGAMLAQCLARNMNTKILVVVGKQTLGSFDEMIRDSFSEETARKIKLISPD